ncbi:hypothetical protein BU24DRAFT_448924 [Aaosphaeria arxii CBS 175.79]|uniref:Uncharacterized protein n=1 Tax=Aaosphaeria arxii CBS 175.79 TaxID=1450172 RepID=A0A6A5XWW3_9PLEO|nr:uncharacterized protein BU24DRAFT_448924 [Aaosphaeria arxii CBS 175.79]KAF2017191.1 hypothetical protein BU24DRAFT_448924 [Aaosphaeria arxii CBS 175.79]
MDAPQYDFIFERNDMCNTLALDTVDAQLKPAPFDRVGTMPKSDFRSYSYNEHETSSVDESHDIVCDPAIPFQLQYAQPRAVGARRSSSTCRSSPPISRASSPSSRRPSLQSSATSTSVLTVEVCPESKPTDTYRGRRPSMLSRLRSSISTTSILNNHNQRPDVMPADFRRPPEYPEKHFIDSVGMVIPGVCDRDQCPHPRSHFVSNWRLCEPIEYTTTLADHGITYSDYCRLLNALSNLLSDIAEDSKSSSKVPSHRWRHRDATFGPTATKGSSANNTTTSSHQPRISRESHGLSYNTRQQASALNKLLADITFHWRARGVPVMVCVGSFSLFGSESNSGFAHPNTSHPFSLLITTKSMEDNSVSGPRRRPSEHSQSSGSLPLQATVPPYHHHQCTMRDRTRPWALWPNAIPTSKRDLITSHAVRYGEDPFFRAWMRANINCRTHSTTYAKFMIEQENNPFINMRLAYVSPISKLASLWSACKRGYNDSSEGARNVSNSKKYEHNRRLECRRTVEHGTRLRIARFAFRHPLYPPHTPEMEELGLTEAGYNRIISDIESIRRSSRVMKEDSTKETSATQCLPFHCIQRRRPEDALTKVSEYIRHLNASQKGLIWTIEKIPGVYEKSLGHKDHEWEISVWNAEDSLELLLQLEKWGIIEKRLDIDDDD